MRSPTAVQALYVFHACRIKQKEKIGFPIINVIKTGVGIPQISQIFPAETLSLLIPITRSMTSSCRTATSSWRKSVDHPGNKSAITSSDFNCITVYVAIIKSAARVLRAGVCQIIAHRGQIRDTVHIKISGECFQHCLTIHLCVGVY